VLRYNGNFRCNSFLSLTQKRSELVISPFHRCHTGSGINVSILVSHSTFPFSSFLHLLTEHDLVGCTNLDRPDHYRQRFHWKVRSLLFSTMPLSDIDFSLSAALSTDVRKKFGITHVLSVCTEYSSADHNHLTIPVQDSEYEDLLIHLPRGCSFIQSALDQGGKVLVHCAMGVSRSPTMVCAYRKFTSLCSLLSLWST
jgi:hypothetical protein